MGFGNFIVEYAKVRNERIETRQRNRTNRQRNRQEGRSERQGNRQEGRSERQGVRQENRTARAEARAATGTNLGGVLNTRATSGLGDNAADALGGIGEGLGDMGGGGAPPPPKDNTPWIIGGLALLGLGVAAAGRR